MTVNKIIEIISKTLYIMSLAADIIITERI